MKRDKTGEDLRYLPMDPLPETPRVDVTEPRVTRGHEETREYLSRLRSREAAVGSPRRRRTLAEVRAEVEAERAAHVAAGRPVPYAPQARREP